MLNQCIHSLVAVAAVVEMLLVPHKWARIRDDLSVVCAFVLGYTAWLLYMLRTAPFCVCLTLPVVAKMPTPPPPPPPFRFYLDRAFPYPFLDRMSWTEFTLFASLVLGMVSLLYLIGRGLCRVRWGTFYREGPDYLLVAKKLMRPHAD